MADLEPSPATRPARASSIPAGPRVDRLARAVATGGGVGYTPLAPGTAGTALAVPLSWALSHLSAPAQLAAIASVGLVGVWAAQRAGKSFGDADDPRIVIDEISGFLVTAALLPPRPVTLALGFALFRAFDQLKPWPASYFDQRVKNGWGNVLDDVVAGLYARACLALILQNWGSS